MASTLTSMLYSLAINPEVGDDKVHKLKYQVEAKVIEEIDSVLGDKELPDWEDLNKLQYCGWVVKETLRIFPPVFMFGRKLRLSIYLCK